MKNPIEWLQKLENEETTVDEVKKELTAEKETAVPQKTEGGARKAAANLLRVHIRSSDGDKVDIKVPLKLAKLFLGKGGGIVSRKGLPGKAFEEAGIDFEDIYALLESGQVGELVDIESSDGDIVKVYVE